MDKNKEIFWILLKPELKKAGSFCRKLIGNSEDGDDLLQDALYAAFRNFDNLQKEATFKPWLYRIIINRYKNEKRSRYLRSFLPLSNISEKQIGTTDPLPQLAARKRLEKAMLAISPNEQVLITLFEIEGWSLKEMAQLTGKSENSLKMKLSRTRRKMRRAMTKSLFPSEITNLTENLEPREKVCVAGKPEKN